LAEKEENEAKILNSILPPLLTAEQIDKHLMEVIASLPPGTNPKRSMGVILKTFYGTVDQGTVMKHLVTERFKALTGA